MKKKVMISEIAIILIILCFAWGYYYFHSTEKSTKKLNPNPQLYEACDEDSCIYLLGTIHVGDERLDGLDEKQRDYLFKTFSFMLDQAEMAFV